MKKKLLVILLFFSFVKADVYINEFLNNTDNQVALIYSVPNNASAQPSNRVSDPYLNGNKNFLFSSNKNKGFAWEQKFTLSKAYIPAARDYSDFHQAITLVLFGNNYTSKDNEIAKIRIFDGYIENIRKQPNSNLAFYKPGAIEYKINELYIATRAVYEKVKNGDLFNIEVKQISDEIYSYNIINRDAFQVTIIKDPAYDTLQKRPNVFIQEVIQGQGKKVYTLRFNPKMTEAYVDKCVLYLQNLQNPKFVKTYIGTYDATIKKHITQDKILEIYINSSMDQAEMQKLIDQMINDINL